MQDKRKTAIVTGGARGFGKAFGKALADGGMHVVLIDLDRDAVEAAATEIGGSAVGHALDVTDEAGITDLFDRIAAETGGIDVLINNAGLHSHAYSRPVAEMGVERTRRLFEVNVMGTVICSLAAQPHMAGREGASMVNIASSAAYMGGAYGTSKLAVIGMTMTLAREFGPDGIRVNAIAPGVILTDTIRDEMAPETLARIKGMQFSPLEGAEQDIVDAMLFLVSPQARFVNGETLRVSNGVAAGA